MEGFTPKCIFGNAACAPPWRTGEVYFKSWITPENAVHELAHAIDWQSALIDSPMNSAPVAHHFSDVWSYPGVTAYGRDGYGPLWPLNHWDRWAEAVTVYVFPNYKRDEREPGPNGKRPVINISSEDLGLQMQRMAALLNGWY